MRAPVDIRPNHATAIAECSRTVGKVSVFQRQNLVSDRQTLHFSLVLSHLTAIESPQHLRKRCRRGASERARGVCGSPGSPAAPLCCLCTVLSHIWKAVVCRLLPAGLCISIIVLAAAFLFFLFSPRGERATFGLSQGQVMISDPISPKHMACPGKLSQFPKIW